MDLIKKCCRCKEEKPAADFSPSRLHRDALCRTCRKARFGALAAEPVVATTHTCGSCHQEKPVTDFFASNVAKRTWGKCRECRQVQYRANKGNEQARHRKRASDKRYHDATANRDLAKKYGMSLAKYEALLAQQNGHCACCGVEDIGRRLSHRLHVDHDHATGEVRGLLCHKCNIGIGAMGDTIAGVKRALAYLERALNTPNPAGLDDAGWLCH